MSYTNIRQPVMQDAGNPLDLSLPEGMESAAESSTGEVVARVYSVTVFVSPSDDRGTLARVANLELEPVLASSVRDALRQTVAAARELIARQVSTGQSIPWIDPPRAARDDESRFVVPLHI